MKILKNYLQNQKGLQKLDTKHVPHASKKDFPKKSKFWGFFYKMGVKGVKKWKFWKNSSKIEKGFKNWIWNMCHTPQKEKKILILFLGDNKKNCHTYP